ncbi:PREDICTED: putative nuclease HARBI1 [Cyphomyrmex costatus]|uniref:putative nuclease HARBI1 n=1 Tax=Cyphomyrmex costatus TaxID=456900 RepID=UPI00085228C4|nr:PREDICTED: putative nuclease HARBI1 [Cyphomyrmex costatus]
MVENIAVCATLLLKDISSESDSSSDEEWDLLRKEKRKRILRPRIQNVELVIEMYSNEDFKSHFRLKRATFEYILYIISEDLVRRTKGCETISPRKQFFIALWKMATMDSYRSICDRFNVGRATGLRAVRRVTRALFKRAHQFISWPSGEEAQAVINKFKENSKFPNTIGAIDGTHIQIVAPKENAVDYINRKGYHSIQLQVVCDYKALITHCYVGHPGSVHDQRIFRQSEVATYLNNEEKFPSDSHLVGDSAYALHEHLLVPYKDNGHLSAAQKHYNFCQSSARVVVERCFALLKGRLRSLLHCLPMTRIDLMAEYIVACCVIHNICILNRDELEIIPLISASDTSAQDHIDQRQANNNGVYKRNMIMNMLQREFN